MAEAINRIVTVWEVEDEQVKEAFDRFKEGQKAVAGNRSEIVKMNEAAKKNDLAKSATASVAAQKKVETELKKTNTLLKKVRANAQAAFDPTKPAKQAAGVRFLAGAYRGLLAVGRTLLTTFAPLFLGLTGLAFFKGIANLAVDYETSLARLSAITGQTGKDLDLLKEKSISLARELKRAPAEILTAFKLIGSARPELLKDAEALEEVTRQAIILSKAAPELGLEGAAQNVGVAVNALELPVSRVADLVNVLAAGSQKGAKEIPFIVDALTKFGGIAASVDEPIESIVASVELLGKKIPEASVAGTNLRNIFTKLIVQAEKQGRSFKGLAGELDLLAERQVSVTELTELFGDRNLLAAQTLITQRNELVNLTAALTGTNTAQEQAAKTSRTVAGLWNAFTAELKASVQETENTTGALTGLLKFGINFLRDGLERLTGTIRQIQLTFRNFGEDLTSVGNIAAGVGSVIVGAFTGSAADIAQGLETIKEGYNSIILNQAEEAALSKEISDNLSRIWQGAAQQVEFNIPAPSAGLPTSLADGFVIPIDIDVDPGGSIEPVLGLIDSIKQRIEEFENKRKSATNPTDVIAFSKQIEKLKEELKGLENPTKVAEEALKKAFSETKKELKLTLDALKELKTEAKDVIEVRTVTENGFSFDVESGIGLDLDEITEMIAAKSPSILNATAALVKGFNDELAKAAAPTAFQVNIDSIIDQVGQFSGVFSDAFDLITNNRIANIDRQLETLEASYARETELAGENATGKIQADERYQARKAQLDKERAKQEQKQALISALLTQANNILKALGAGPPFPNFFAGALAAVAGGVQIAAIKSNRGFFRGTKNAPEGFAWVGENGPELRHGKDGKVSIVGQSGPELMYLDRGDKIHKNESSLTQQALKMSPDELSFMNNDLLSGIGGGAFDFKGISDMINVTVNVEADKGSTRLLKEVQKLNRTMESKPVSSFSFDGQGYSKYLTHVEIVKEKARTRNQL